MRTIKSITAKEIFRQLPEVKKQMWGGEFRSDDYFINTVGGVIKENNDGGIGKLITLALGTT